MRLKLTKSKKTKRVVVQTENNRTRLILIVKWVPTKRQITLVSQEQEVVEQAQVLCSTIHLFSKNTLKDHCWLKVVSSILDVGYSGTTTAKFIFSKKVTYVRQVSYIKLIQTNQMTCLLIWQTMPFKKQAKIMGPLKMGIKLAMLPSNNIVRHRLLVRNYANTLLGTISYPR